MENLLKMLESNPDLLEQVVKLWTDGAPNEKIAEAFAAKGVPVEAEQIEQLLALLQKARAKVIEKGITDENLKKVAGGGKSGCSDTYYVQACTDTVESDSSCWTGDYCHLIYSHYDVRCTLWVQGANNGTGQ